MMFKLVFIFGIFLNPNYITALQPSFDGEHCAITTSRDKQIVLEKTCLEITREITRQLRKEWK